jgi:cytochrome b561
MQPQWTSGATFTGVVGDAPARTAHLTRHSVGTIAMHWFSVLAIVAATASILARELVETQFLRVALMEMHRQAGLFVVLALILRLAIRFKVGMADHSAGMPLMLRIAAFMGHLGLYVMLFALPVLGWAVSNAHSVPLKLMGLIPLPDLVGADSDLADTLTDFHVWAAWGMLALVVAHIAAALWHHFGRRDQVLMAMLPASRKR